MHAARTVKNLLTILHYTILFLPRRAFFIEISWLGSTIFNMEMSVVYKMAADFLMDIAAGWYGAVVISPLFTTKQWKIKTLFVIIGVINMVLSMYISYQFSLLLL